MVIRNMIINLYVGIRLDSSLVQDKQDDKKNYTTIFFGAFWATAINGPNCIQSIHTKRAFYT